MGLAKPIGRTAELVIVYDNDLRGCAPISSGIVNVTSF